MIPIIYRAIPTDSLVLNDNETAMRLHTAKGFETEQINLCLKELKSAASCKFSAVRMPVSYLDGDTLDCGFGEFKSKMLIKNLKNSKEVFIFAATLGLGVDRLLTQMSLSSPAKHFITDALASSMAEALADKAEELIRNGIDCLPRFSPGYGDLPLEIQPKMLTLLNAQRLLGITINNALLMSPGKSVTAIMGIKNE